MTCAEHITGPWCAEAPKGPQAGGPLAASARRRQVALLFAAPESVSWSWWRWWSLGMTTQLRGPPSSFRGSRIGSEDGGTTPSSRSNDL